MSPIPAIVVPYAGLDPAAELAVLVPQPTGPTPPAPSPSDYKNPTGPAGEPWWVRAYRIFRITL